MAPATALDWDWYVGAGAGWAGHDRFATDDSATRTVIEQFGAVIEFNSNDQISTDGDDAAWQLSGGAWLHEHLGFEIGYVDLGETSTNQRTVFTQETTFVDFSNPQIFFNPPPGILTNTSEMTSHVDIRGVSLLAKTRFPLFRRIDLIVSLGAVRWDLDGVTQQREAFQSRFYGSSSNASSAQLRPGSLDTAPRPLKAVFAMAGTVYKHSSLWQAWAPMTG
jgi:hypothetical protein